jgi:hypothetical protein
MKASLFCCAGLLTAIVMVTPVRGNVLTLAPTQAVVLPTDESGQTRIAVLFDVSGVPSGRNRRIDEALLEWVLGSVSINSESEFTAKSVGTSWTIQSIVTSQPEVAEEVARWHIGPLDYERNGGAFVRLDIASLVEGWASGLTSNYGVLITTKDLSRTVASAHLNDIRLTIRYGFRRI